MGKSISNSINISVNFLENIFLKLEDTIKKDKRLKMKTSSYKIKCQHQIQMKPLKVACANNKNHFKYKLEQLLMKRRNNK